MQPNWSRNKAKIEVNFDMRFLQKRVVAAAGARKTKIGRSKLRANIDQKVIQKLNQEGEASWHPFLFDFGGFGDPSWEKK